MRSLIIGMGVAILMAAAPAARADDEEKVPLDKLPKGIVDAVKARFPDAELKEASKVTDQGTTTFEVGIEIKKQELDVELTPDGVIFEIEKEIDVKDLPKPVVKALGDKYPKAEYDGAEEVTTIEKKTDNLAYYEVQVKTADKKRFEVQVDPEGTILHEEKKGNED